MGTIHLIDGEKGGVGKSLVARTMIQYCLDKNFPMIAVETDRSNPDVAGIYKGVCQYAVFSENERQADRADRVFEMAVEKPVIVNLAAQAHRAVKDWIDKNHLMEIAPEHGVKFCKWFVCNGGYDSVNLFVQSLNSYDSRMHHVLVRNWGVCDEWTQVEEDESLKKLIKKQRFDVINFPKLAYKEGYIINQKRMRFDEALLYKAFGIIGKQRVVNFLKESYTAFDQYWSV